MTTPGPPFRLPKITIEFCVQCKWNLRAAYFAQELLQTFSTSIGEISLIPVTGGIFIITLYHRDTPGSEAQPQQDPQTENVIPSTDSPNVEPITTHLIWDRKRDGGFPETKELKNRVRNVIEPGKDMGHVDRALRKGKEGEKKVGETVGPHDHANQTQDEQSRSKVGTGSVSHAGHGTGTAVPDDCEECKEAAKERV